MRTRRDFITNCPFRWARRARSVTRDFGIRAPALEPSPISQQGVTVRVDTRVESPGSESAGQGKSARVSARRRRSQRGHGATRRREPLGAGPGTSAVRPGDLRRPRDPDRDRLRGPRREPVAPSRPPPRVVRPGGGLRGREPAPRRNANARARRVAQPDRDPCEQRRHARVAECPAHCRKAHELDRFPELGRGGAPASALPRRHPRRATHGSTGERVQHR